MENSTLWFSLTNMICLFLLSSVCRFIQKFIMEANSFLKTLIPLFDHSGKTSNPPVSVPVDEEEEDDESLYGDDVSSLMEKMGLQPCKEMKSKMNSGEISRIFEEREPSIEELKAAFDVFDQNKDGFIDAFELKRVIEILGLGKGFDLGACKKMIRVFDVNGDDKIYADQFFGFMRKTLC